MAHFSIEETKALTSDEDVRRVLADPGFAVHHTDHMATARYADGKWGGCRIRPYEDLVLKPNAMALHYGQEIFEGMKAFILPDGTASMFRPEQNAKRFNLSAQRMAMPELPEEIFLEACDEIVRLDKRWIPDGEGTSLYLRPFMIATEPNIGVRAAWEFEFHVIAFPTSPFFSSGFEPITVGVLSQYSRASVGGTGEAKCSGNYATSLLAKEIVKKQGCSEAMWLDASEHKYIEELSGMNVFFVEQLPGDGARLVTPPLNGTILRGITRDSLLQMAATLGYQVEEREIAIDEVKSRAAAGEITEAFACGTAAVIAPISRIILNGSDEISVGDGGPGKVTTHLYEELVAVQVGQSSLYPEWRRVVG